MTSCPCARPVVSVLAVAAIAVLADAVLTNGRTPPDNHFLVTCLHTDQAGVPKHPDKKCPSCQEENTGRWNKIQKDFDFGWKKSTALNDTFSLLGLDHQWSIPLGEKSQRDDINSPERLKLHTFLRKILFFLFRERKHPGKKPKVIKSCVRRCKNRKSCGTVANREFRERCQAYKERMDSIDRLRELRRNLAAQAAEKLGSAHAQTTTGGRKRKRKHDWLERLAFYYDRCSNLDAATVDRSGRLKVFVGKYVITLDRHNRETDLSPITPRAIRAGRKLRKITSSKLFKRITTNKSVLKRVLLLAKRGVDAIGKRGGELYFVRECTITSLDGTLKGSVAISLKAIGLPCDVDAAWTDPTDGAMVVAKDDRLWYWMPRQSRVQGPYDANLVLGLSSTALCPSPEEVSNAEKMMDEAMREELRALFRAREGGTDEEKTTGGETEIGLEDKFSSSTQRKGGQWYLEITYQQYRNGRLSKTETKSFPLKSDNEEDKRNILENFKEKVTSGTASANHGKKTGGNSGKEGKTTRDKRMAVEEKGENDPGEELNVAEEDEPIEDEIVMEDEPVMIDEIDEEGEGGQVGVGECVHPGAAYVDGEGILVLIQGSRYYKIDKQNKEVGDGNIRSLFKDIPWNPEAAVTFPDKTVFFKGNKLAVYHKGELTLSSLPVSTVTRVDAVGSHDGVQFLASGCLVHSYDGKRLGPTAQAHELNLPCDVDAAWSNRESGSGSMTVLKGDRYWVWPSFYRSAIGPFKANQMFNLKSRKFCS